MLWQSKEGQSGQLRFGMVKATGWDAVPVVHPDGKENTIRINYDEQNYQENEKGYKRIKGKNIRINEKHRTQNQRITNDNLAIRELRKYKIG